MYTFSVNPVFNKISNRFEWKSLAFRPYRSSLKFTKIYNECGYENGKLVRMGM